MNEHKKRNNQKLKFFDIDENIENHKQLKCRFDFRFDLDFIFHIKLSRKFIKNT